MDETTDLGKDAGSAISDDYTPDNSAFTGTVNWVQLDIGEDSQDQLITPEDRLRTDGASIAHSEASSTQRSYADGS